jgi:hypothetical protein
LLGFENHQTISICTEGLSGRFWEAIFSEATKSFGAGGLDVR